MYANWKIASWDIISNLGKLFCLLLPQITLKYTYLCICLLSIVRQKRKRCCLFCLFAFEQNMANFTDMANIHWYDKLQGILRLLQVYELSIISIQMRRLDWFGSSGWGEERERRVAVAPEAGDSSAKRWQGCWSKMPGLPLTLLVAYEHQTGMKRMAKCNIYSRHL